MGRNYNMYLNLSMSNSNFIFPLLPDNANTLDQLNPSNFLPTYGLMLSLILLVVKST